VKEMTDLERVKVFNKYLDQVIQSGEVPSGPDVDPVHQDMLKVAQKMTSIDLSALSKKRENSRRCLLERSEPTFHRTANLAYRIASTFIILIFIFIASCAISPTLRAKTKEAIARIGNFLLTRGTTSAEESLLIMRTATPYYGDVALTPVTLIPLLSQEEASLMVGFPVLVPREVPEQEWEKAYRPSWGNPKEISLRIYADSDGVTVHCDCFLWHEVVIRQLTIPVDEMKEFPISEADIQQIEVRGRTGYWIEDAPIRIIGGGGSIWGLTEDDIVWQLGYSNVLIWEEEGIVYMIFGDDELSYQDLNLVAETLEP
jgi:hypothetical protein